MHEYISSIARRQTDELWRHLEVYSKALRAAREQDDAVVVRTLEIATHALRGELLRRQGEYSGVTPDHTTVTVQK